ncbi:MAG: hypothetical protein ACO3NK_05935 [Prochlorotrichaceae cyanobacterium]
MFQVDYTLGFIAHSAFRKAIAKTPPIQAKARSFLKPLIIPHSHFRVAKAIATKTPSNDRAQGSWDVK